MFLYCSSKDKIGLMFISVAKASINASKKVFGVPYEEDAMHSVSVDKNIISRVNVSLQDIYFYLLLNPL